MAEYIDREALLHDIEQSVVYTVREKITSAEMRGAHKVIERIKCAPAVEPIYIHEPTKSEFKRMAVQMDYVPMRHGEWEGYTHSRFCGLDEFSEPIYRDGVVYYCSNPRCRRKTVIKENYCPSCGAKMTEVLTDE